MTRGSQASRWELTQPALDGLLAALDPERHRAARRYREIHRRLILFFTQRGDRQPEEGADETINRVAGLLQQGREVRDLDGRYFLGVARMIHKERRRKNRERPVGLDLEPAARSLGKEPAELESPRVDCMQKCLRALPAAEKKLLLEYYHGEKGRKIDNRKRLAARLGIDLNLLRQRMFSLRRKLRGCTLECLRKSASDAAGS